MQVNEIWGRETLQDGSLVHSLTDDLHLFFFGRSIEGWSFC
jgi:hypothetical protein